MQNQLADLDYKDSLVQEKLLHFDYKNCESTTDYLRKGLELDFDYKKSLVDKHM